MKSPEKKLLNVFRNLSTEHRRTLIAFAEFLDTQYSPGADDNKIETPLQIKRPETETVIAAIKRLSETFPMLDKARLLNDTSNLVTQHVMQGRPVVDVIDELEIVFQRHYEEYSKQ